MKLSFNIKLFNRYIITITNYVSIRYQIDWISIYFFFINNLMNKLKCRYILNNKLLLFTFISRHSLYEIKNDNVGIKKYHSW